MKTRTEYGVARDRFGKVVIDLIDTEEKVDSYLEQVRRLAPIGASGVPYKVTRVISDWEPSS